MKIIEFIQNARNAILENNEKKMNTISENCKCKS